MSRRVRVLQPQDVLESAGSVPRDRGPSQGTLRRSLRGEVQPAGHLPAPEEPPVQQADQGGPHIHGPLARLLLRERHHGHHGDSGTAL